MKKRLSIYSCPDCKTRMSLNDMKLPRPKDTIKCRGCGVSISMKYTPKDLQLIRSSYHFQFKGDKESEIIGDRRNHDIVKLIEQAFDLQQAEIERKENRITKTDLYSVATELGIDHKYVSQVISNMGKKATTTKKEYAPPKEKSKSYSYWEAYKAMPKLGQFFLSFFVSLGMVFIGSFILVKLQLI